MPSPQTVHIGDFNAAKKPVLTIDSGDIVTVVIASAIIDYLGIVMALVSIYRRKRIFES